MEVDEAPTTTETGSDKPVESGGERFRENSYRPEYDLEESGDEATTTDTTTNVTDASTDDQSPAPAAAGDQLPAAAGDQSPAAAGGQSPSTEQPDKKPKKVPPFKVLGVDYHAAANRKAHHSVLYEHGGLIIRRGQEFDVSIRVDRQFEKDKDAIKIQLSMGNTPKITKGTKFIITPGGSIDTKIASAVISGVEDSVSGSTINLKLSLPADSVIGNFKMVVRMRNQEDEGDDKQYIKHTIDEGFIVLFNPWNADDSVYLSGEAEIKEYILSDFGKIYVGASYFPHGKLWAFAQFDKASLDAALYVLDNSQLPWAGYGNPVRVTRTLSAMVNSNDADKGILTGNWSGDYSGGTSPTVWSGSARILEEYMENKKMVNYGQCWVFSGVMTTVCRALGIPARSVTNFDSGHDTDISLTIDYHQDEEGNPMRRLNDSVWNFHVWNEGWFTRPDLPEGYGGWQAFDATPQEQSDGAMQCGPAPLTAIKKGDVHLGFDTKFVFAEVNGDRVTWVVNKLGEHTPIKVEKDCVGHKLSTKAVGSIDREDITNQYKYPEGSEEERGVIKKVAKHSTRRDQLEKHYQTNTVEDVRMTFEGKVKEAGDAEFVFIVNNTTKEERTVDAFFHLMATYYTGIPGNKIENRRTTLYLGPGQEDRFGWVTSSDWLNKIAEDANLGIYMLAKVKETGQTYSDIANYQLDKPDLTVTVNKTAVKVWESVDVTISFTNPLDLTLTQSSFNIEGAGIQGVQKVILPATIDAKKAITKTVQVTPKMAGKREIIASFHSRQLVNIQGSVQLDVE